MKRTYYLDIDMDYFVLPIQKAAVDNIRIFKAEDCITLPVAPLREGLEKAGLSWDKGSLHCFTNHKKSYTYWWMDKHKDCTVIHIDAHSDLYRNSRKDLRLLSNSELGCYNYLWYAIRDGYVNEIYWVLPDALKHIINCGSAGEIINKDLIAESREDEAGLHISFRCIDINGVDKAIMLHVCTIEQLPYFGAKCRRVTIATSPEFIPEKADKLVYELLESFGADDALKQNIYRQHKDMLLKPEHEVEEARKRLGLSEKNAS
jgi:hypothetical protein